MSKYALLGIIGLVALVTGVSKTPLASAQTQNRCSSSHSDDNVALARIRRFVADTGKDSDGDAFRKSIGVYGVDSAAVVRVTDDSTCAAAVTARAQYRAITDDGRPIRVFTVGNRYFVEEIGSREWRVIWIFDKSWSHIDDLAL